MENHRRCGLFTNRMFWSLFLIPLSLLLPMDKASASLIGDSVNATIINTHGSGLVGTQFTSPNVVGAGIEFTGNWLFLPVNQDWRVDLDISASSFQVTLTNLTGPDNIFSQGLFDIQLTDLDWVGVPGSIVDVTQTVGDPRVITGINFTTDTITVSWNSIPNQGFTYGFDIVAEHQVPEPTTLALMSIGLAGIGYRRHRSKKAIEQ